MWLELEAWLASESALKREEWWGPDEGEWWVGGTIPGSFKVERPKSQILMAISLTPSGLSASSTNMLAGFTSLGGGGGEGGSERVCWACQNGKEGDLLQLG